jgi:iron complex outermembrane recepter protein
MKSASSARALTYALCISTPLLASAAAAQSAPQPKSTQPALEEIVVSEFRRTLATDVSVSLTQINQATIEDYALQHFEELIQLVPNMNYSGEGSRARYFQLRGVGELEQYEGAPNPSVGFIVDDIDLSDVGGISNTFDLQQVEVLRGPQGTRFGGSALAGLVYAETANPTMEPSVNAEVLVGSDDQFGIGAAAGGSLGRNVQGRVSAYQYQANGFRDNEFLDRDDTNGRDELNLRGKLLWQLGNDWAAKFSALYADFSNGYDAFVIDNGRNTFSDKPGEDSQQTVAGSLKLSGPLSSSVTFVSITSVAETDVLFSFDADWGNNEGYWGPYGYDYFASTDRDRSSATQEFRLLSSESGRIWGDSTEWLVGVYGRSLDENSDENLTGFYDDTVDGSGAFCPGGCFERTRLQSEFDSTNLALFGKLETRLSERWTLITGLRVERWEADYSDSFVDLQNSPNTSVANQFNPDANLWGGNITLRFEVTESSQIYGLISRGYKAGGFNPSLARIALPPDGQVTTADIVYEPETLLNYEIGYKGLWLDGTLVADVSAFYMERNDMQIKSSAQQTPGDPFSFIFITSNGQGSAYGLESSLTWQFAENWQVFGALGLLDTKVERYKFTNQEPIIGREFANAPPYTVNVGTTYRNAQGWFGRVDVLGRGAFYYDYSHNRKSSAYQTVNLKLGKEWERWSVYAWGRNILNETYFTRGFFFGNEPPAFEDKLYTKYGDPATYGVTANYAF